MLVLIDQRNRSAGSAKAFAAAVAPIAAPMNSRRVSIEPSGRSFVADDHARFRRLPRMAEENSSPLFSLAIARDLQKNRPLGPGRASPAFLRACLYSFGGGGWPRTRKRSAAPKKAQKRRPAPARKRGQTGAKRPPLGSASPSARAGTPGTLHRRGPFLALLESICGTADDSQPVEQYNGTLGVTAGFVAAHQSGVSGPVERQPHIEVPRIPATYPACGGAAER